MWPGACRATWPPRFRALGAEPRPAPNGIGRRAQSACRVWTLCGSRTSAATTAISWPGCSAASLPGRCARTARASPSPTAARPAGQWAACYADSACPAPRAGTWSRCSPSQTGNQPPGWHRWPSCWRTTTCWRWSIGVAGCLVLQYRQSCWRLVNLTADDVLAHPDDPGILGLQLGRDPLWLRPRLSMVLHQLVNNRRPLAGALRHRPTPYLFPGLRPDRPIASATLQTRLRKLVSPAPAPPATAPGCHWSARSTGRCSPTCSASPTPLPAPGTGRTAVIAPATSPAAFAKDSAPLAPSNRAGAGQRGWLASDIEHLVPSGALCFGNFPFLFSVSGFRSSTSARPGRTPQPERGR